MSWTDSGVFQFAHAGGVRLGDAGVCGGGGVSIRARGGRATCPATGAGGVRAGFNSRTRGACDFDRKRADLKCEFQFAHAGGVRPRGDEVLRADAVSIRARGGRATRRRREAREERKFQFAHAGGVRPGPVRIALRRLNSFNSRTRGACDLERAARRLDCKVSIRARGGRATAHHHRPQEPSHVSIRARGGRATGWYDTAWEVGGFNSRTRGACDPMGVGAGLSAAVSIRARGGRATPVLFDWSKVPWFQFAHAGGVRPPRNGGGRPPRSFNSRTRGACDPGPFAVALVRQVSIRARGGRAT